MFLYLSISIRFDVDFFQIPFRFDVSVDVLKLKIRFDVDVDVC